MKASPLTTMAYVCVTTGALLRVAAALDAGPYNGMLDAAGILWGTALLLFVIAYARIL